jgi:hypothetical protein
MASSPTYINVTRCLVFSSSVFVVLFCVLSVLLLILFFYCNCGVIVVFAGNL